MNGAPGDLEDVGVTHFPILGIIPSLAADMPPPALCIQKVKQSEITNVLTTLLDERKRQSSASNQVARRGTIM
jgi:hypothetical protein